MDILKQKQVFTNRLICLERSPETIRGYDDGIEAYLTHFNRDPKTITFNETVEYLNSRKVHTRKRDIAAIKSFYRLVFNSTKFDKLGYPKPEYTADVLSEDQVRALIKSASNIKHKTMIMLIYTSGIRVTELINLKWTAIDRANMSIRIKAGKGAKDRIVPLTKSMLEQLIAYCKALELRCFNSQDYLFKGQKKPRYSRRSVESFIEKYALLAGIKTRVSPHTLRHCFATHLKERGKDSMDIKRILGHKHLSTTERYTKTANVVKDVPDLMD
jgi:integrase/recombinase XerD